MVNPLPTYHIYPLAVSLMCLIQGATVRLVPDPRDIATVLAEMRRAPFEMLIGVNTLFNTLVNSGEVSSVAFGATRLVTGAGAPVEEAVARRWTEAGGPPITEGYGLTETSPSATFNPTGRTGSIGLPLPSTEARIVDDQGVDVPLGSAGELLLRGPQLFAGYWGREAETRAAMTAEGWFRTGDIVTMDGQGFLRLVSRKKEMILVSGFNVYPNEIEAVVNQMQSVSECACVGIPHEHTGEAPCLFVVAKEQGRLSETEVEAHCRVNLAAYKVPRRIHLVDSLPKSTIGKILKPQLVALARSFAGK
jgi:long-chain acyl-CoA synthetase